MIKPAVNPSESIVMPQSVDMGVQLNQRSDVDKDLQGEHRDLVNSLNDIEFDCEEDAENDCPFNL